MNWFEVPDGVTQRVIARCGVVHPHADLDPKRTALIVVDLQNAFMDDAVGHAVCPMARDIVRGCDREWSRNLYSPAMVPDAVFYFQVGARQLVESLGGTIRAEAGDGGVGTAMVFSIPWKSRSKTRRTLIPRMSNVSWTGTAWFAAPSARAWGRNAICAAHPRTRKPACFTCSH